MVKKHIFYSWQSDLNHEFNWKLIQRCLETAIASFNSSSPHVNFSLDLATRGVPGSPDIVDSIFKKIEKSSILVADITPVSNLGEKGIPNPNVLIELGYAVGIVGWDNIICVSNKSYGSLEILPFDIKHRRISGYDLNSEKNRSKQETTLTQIFDIAISTIHQNQAENDQITKIFKLRIDHVLLTIVKHFNNMFEIKRSSIGIDVFYEVLNVLQIGFKEGKKVVARNTEKLLENTISELNEITKHPLLILNKKVNQITSVIELVEALTLLRNNIVAGRFYEKRHDKEKQIIKDVGVMNILLADISRAVENVLANWGDHLLTNPALL